MKKAAVGILISLLLMSCVLCACDSMKEKPFDNTYNQVSQTYIAFIETAMKDWQKAVNEFCNLDAMDEDSKERVLSGDLLVSYEIIRFEKLSDSLWVVETLTKTEEDSNGTYGVNYVGLLNGKWDVFLNKRNIPTVLTEGVEIPDYEIHDAAFH